jgi:hypothetical protein
MLTMITACNFKILFIFSTLILSFCFVWNSRHLHALWRRFCMPVSCYKKETVVDVFREFLCEIRNEKQKGLATCRGQ